MISSKTSKNSLESREGGDDRLRTADWLSQCREGWSLPGPFYSDPAIYRLDLDRIWRGGWLFAAHSCELSNPGDYICLNVGADPIVVVRGQDNVARAFFNVCRHRGSLVCVSDSGRAQRLVCPYHQWAYDLDGK